MLVNGTRTHFFSPSRGIRKREPMCPYIFILCIEVLSNYINHKVNILKWDPITISSRGPHFSYLFFTDDLTLIAKANTKTIHTIHHVLFTFCSLSGQRVNATKSRAVFSPACNTNICALVHQLLNINKSINFWCYLGFPILQKKPTPKDFQYLIDNFRNKLATWKVHYLD